MSSALTVTHHNIENEASKGPSLQLLAKGQLVDHLGLIDLLFTSETHESPDNQLCLFDKTIWDTFSTPHPKSNDSSPLSRRAGVAIRVRINPAFSASKTKLPQECKSPDFLFVTCTTQATNGKLLS